MGLVIEADDRGLYSLCVFHAEDKADDEMKQTFEKFGDIARFHRNKNNLLFISFNTGEEAQECMNAFPGPPETDFRVRPAKPKSRNPDQPRQDNDAFNRKPKGFQQRNFEGGDSYSRSEPSKQKPNLVPKYVEAETADSPKPVVLKGVVIGNLHKYTKQSDVLTLCSSAKATVLHIDMRSFEKPQYRKIFYAIVYVKTDEDVQNICKGLNNLKWNGFQLVVKTVEAAKESGKM